MVRKVSPVRTNPKMPDTIMTGRDVASRCACCRVS